MIIYGSKAKEVASETVSDKCQNCGAQDKIELHVFQKYAHIFWIPLFPTGKTGVSQCHHCKQVLKLKEMPASLRTSYNTIRAKGKTPAWMFSGLAIIILFISLGGISESQKNKKNAQFILAPQDGDIFEIKTSNGQYTLYKVDHLAGDTIFIKPSMYEANKISGLNDIRSKGESVFIYDLIPIQKAELKQMFDRGEIMDIERK